MFSCQEISLYILHWSYACLLPWRWALNHLLPLRVVESQTQNDLLERKCLLAYEEKNCKWQYRCKNQEDSVDKPWKVLEYALTRKTFGAHSPRAEVLFFPFISFRDKVVCIMLYPRLGSHGPRRNEFRDSFWGIYEKVVGAKKCCMLSCLLMGERVSKSLPQCPPH